MTELDFLQRVAQAKPRPVIKPIAKNENMGACHHETCIKRARWSCSLGTMRFQTCHKHKHLLAAIR